MLRHVLCMGMAVLALGGCVFQRPQQPTSELKTDGDAAAAAEADDAAKKSTAEAQTALTADPDGKPIVLAHADLTGPLKDAEVTMQRVHGVNAKLASSWLSPALPAISRCHPPEHGKVRVAMASTAKGTVLKVVEASVLDTATQTCIMRALGLVNEDAFNEVLMVPVTSATYGSSPSDEAQAVSSTFVISW